MSHSDDRGLVVPPKIAPVHIVMIPIYKTDEEFSEIMEVCNKIKRGLGEKYSVKIDDRDTKKPGVKFFEWEKKGVPIRIEIGPRDLKNGQAVLVRRDLNSKSTVSLDNIETHIPALLDEIQNNLLEKHRKFREDNTMACENYSDFKGIFEGDGAFVKSPWCESAECEAKIQEETKATIRTLPMYRKEEPCECIYCGKPSKLKVIFAKSY